MLHDRGKDIFIYSGTFHYFRCPKELWPARFQAIKDAGFNTVETYVAWNWHEQEMPDSLTDFSKVKGLDDLDDWMTMAEKYGLYIIIRPGPYICAEWSNGGFPRWMSTLEKPAAPLRPEGWLRSDDPVYLAWCKHWYDAVCPVIAKHQITRKAPGEPGVILFQVENEYDFWTMPAKVKINDVSALAQYAVADGIDVPLVSCWTKQVRGVKNGPLRGDIRLHESLPDPEGRGAGGAGDQEAARRAARRAARDHGVARGLVRGGRRQIERPATGHHAGADSEPHALCLAVGRYADELLHALWRDEFRRLGRRLEYHEL